MYLIWDNYEMGDPWEASHGACEWWYKHAEKTRLSTVETVVEFGTLHWLYLCTEWNLHLFLEVNFNFSHCSSFLLGVVYIIR